MNGMRQLRLLTITGLVLLAACGRSDSGPVVVEAASRALVPVLLLQRTNAVLPSQLRPAAAIGVMTSGFLALRSLPAIGAALQGIAIQRMLLPPDRPVDDRVYGVLTELGSALEVDIPDYLNRSVDRAAALESYIETLTRLMQEADDQRTQLEQEIARLKAEEKEQKTRVRDLEKSARAAQKDGNYALAGSAQEELASASADLARTEAIVDQRDDTLSLYEDLLEVAGERLTAITQNREILIAGLRVIEVPGIEDLQILESGGTFRRMGTRSSGNRIDALGY